MVSQTKYTYQKEVIIMSALNPERLSDEQKKIQAVM